MDDDWDDGTAPVSAPPVSSFGCASEGGVKFAKGRGFRAAESNNNGHNGWGDGATKFEESGWDDAPVSTFGNNNRGGRGGFRGGWKSSHQGDTWGESGGWGDNKDDERTRGRGRGRGGRGSRGGRGGGAGFSGAHREPEETTEKPREIYIPEERVADSELFTTTTITSGVNFLKLDDIDVKVSGEDVPQPMASFETSGLRQHLLDNIKKSGYSKPTPIQKYAVPVILAGRDLMGCAQTGSGKTAAFLLPMIQKILESNTAPVTENGCSQPSVVIVSPTRELSTQIYEQAKKFSYNSIVKTVVVYGGTSVIHQRNQVQAGCHVLVATPGRLNDFVTRGHVSFASVQFFVLDEADRMLDMGFLPTIEQMLAHPTMPATGDRQTLMFSATFPEEIQHLAGKFLHNYVFVAVGIVGSASTDVEQVFHQVAKYDKRNKLVEMLKESRNERTVVFVETKRNADFLATYLSENDIPTTSIHGDRLQRQREQALWDFKKGFRNILVATGVAARGLDIEGIQHVINYDLPKSIDEYVHRIGRTGRVGNRGKATSFFDSSCDSALASSLAKILQQAGQEVPDWLSGGGFGYGGENDGFGGRDIRGDDFGRGQDFNAFPAEEADCDW